MYCIIIKKLYYYNININCYILNTFNIVVIMNMLYIFIIQVYIY